MAATVNINRITGSAPGVKNNITGINTRANAEDVHSISGTANPITIPASGNKYSFWVTTRLEVISGLGGTIDNLRWYMSGSLDAGVSLNGQTASSYVQATGVVGDSGDQLNLANHPGLTGAPEDLTAYTSGSPKSVTGSTSSTGDFGDRVVYQFAIGPTAAPGGISPITMTWRYDET